MTFNLINFFDDSFNGSKIQYNKGCNLLSQSSFDEASNIFNALLRKHPQAGLKLVETEYKLALFILNQGDEENAFKKFLNTITIKNDISSTFDSTALATIENNCKIQLAKIDYKKGIQLEQQYNYSTAISQYKKASDFINASVDNQLYLSIIARLEICNIKNGIEPNLNNINYIGNDISLFNQDLFYRYALYLLKKEKIAEAETVIQKHLGFNSSEISILKTYCQNYYKKRINTKIHQLNERVDTLYQHGFPLPETKALYDEIDIVSSEVSKFSKSAAKSIIDLKPSLFNKLLHNYLAANKNEEAIRHITSYNNFFDHHILIKNLGIASLKAASSNQITAANYTDIISCWLTAIYSDRAILKSLEQTSWDDQYTFTLINSIGTNYIIDFDLENVNYDEISDSNISIGSTQNELVETFENLIHTNIENPLLAEKIQSFYQEEKYAIEQIVKFISADITFATPSFANKYHLSEGILAELYEDYQQSNNEDAIVVGALYATTSSNIIFKSYYEAKEISKRVLAAVSTLNRSELTNLQTAANKALLQKFSSIKDNIEEKILIAFKIKIDEDYKNEKLINPMISCINLLPNSNKLREQFSQFVSVLCVNKINDGSLTNFQALQYMVYALNFTANNRRVCENLSILLKFNLWDLLNDKVNNAGEIFKVIDSIIKKNNSTLKSHCSDIAEMRTSIMSHLDSSTKISFIHGQGLSPKGLELKKALDYMFSLTN